MTECRAPNASSSRWLWLEETLVDAGLTSTTNCSRKWAPTAAVVVVCERSGVNEEAGEEEVEEMATDGADGRSRLRRSSSTCSTRRELVFIPMRNSNKSEKISEQN